MKRMFLVVGTAVVILPWLAAARVQAGPIGWSIYGGPVPSHGSTVLESHNFGLNGTIELGGSSGPLHPISGTSSESVVLATMRTYFASSHPGVLLFGGPSANYSLNLVLNDLASGASGSLAFRGNLSGSISLDQVNLTNTFLGPTTQTLKLGRNQYIVTVGPFVSPGPLTRNSFYVGTPTYFSEPDGSISVNVHVVTPEPSSLVLACLGLPSLGLAGCFSRQRRRQKVTAQPATDN